MSAQVIILCGGQGTRLHALYSDRPKILVPIAGRPFIEWQLEWLGRQGLTDIHLAAGYKAEVLAEWLATRSQEAGNGKWRAEDGNQTFSIHIHPAASRLPLPTFRLSLSTEPSPLGTGGGLKHVEPWLRSDPFLVVNGDSLVSNLDPVALIEHQRQSGNSITIAVTCIERTGRYGTVECDATGHVTAFLEKMERSQGWVNAGVYAVSQQIMADIAAGRPVSLETHLFPTLAERGLIGAMPCLGPLLDMGTPDGIATMEAWLTTTTLAR
jgi:NDP-sugar pyrophosphorylase family protein